MDEAGQADSRLGVIHKRNISYYAIYFEGLFGSSIKASNTQNLFK